MQQSCSVEKCKCVPLLRGVAVDNHGIYSCHHERHHDQRIHDVALAAAAAAIFGVGSCFAGE